MTHESGEAQDRRVARAVGERVEIVPYDAEWPRRFQEERVHLLSCLPAALVRRIEHFGSTAVPGLAAKPVIDVFVEVTDLEETRKRIVPILDAQGYEYFWRPTFGEDVRPFYAWFIKRDPRTGARTHHVHMVEGGDRFAGHRERLLFRDYLIEHPRVAQEYGRLKARLAAEFPGDRVAYTRGKTEFIEQVMREARARYGGA